MDIKEIISRVKRIEIKSRRKASGLFMGEYYSSFKGKGMIFSEVRPYQYGDDVRNIDWNKTAQFGEPYIKIFEEERELTMILMVDISASAEYGTRKQLKIETIAEICATLAFSAMTYNDRVGLILYTDRIEKYIPPKKGKSHVLRMISELLNNKAVGKQNNLENALEFVMNVVHQKANIFILSDFIDLSDYNRILRTAARKHDIAGIRIYDEKEKEFPAIGLVHMEDNETGEVRVINTSSPQVRKMYAQYFIDAENRFKAIFTKNNAGNINIQADEDYIKPLLNYFKKHQSS